MIGWDLVLRWAVTARNSRLQMGQEQFEAARTLGFEIRNPQRFAHNMARLAEEAGKAAASLHATLCDQSDAFQPAR